MTKATGRGGDWFGHPRGLTILFLTETWEQFSYYGMRALLVYYMTKQLLISQEHSSLIYAAYTAGAYFTPIIGGYVADRFLGRRRAVIVGGSIMAAGHFMMAWEPLFAAALITIAVGNGLYVPSIPSQIPRLYDTDDPRRATAYNVYYVGGNLGGVLAPLVCGLLGETLGWHWGFAAAGIGMALGLVIFLAGRRWLPPDEVAPRQTRTKVSLDTDASRRFLLLGLVLAFVIVFRCAYEQVGNTVALWIEGVDRHVGGGIEIPMTWFQSLNALLVIVLTPILLLRWESQARRGKAGSSLAKMSLGALILGCAYLLLAAVTSSAGPASPHWIWAVVFFVLLTLGELYVLPVGLGLFGRLAPRSIAATLIGVWYLGISAGSLGGGLLGATWTRLGETPFFVLIAAVAGAASLLFLVLEPFGRTIEQDEARRNPPSTAK